MRVKDVRPPAKDGFTLTNERSNGVASEQLTDDD